jgi:ElaA protein
MFTPVIEWKTLRFDQLTTTQLYQLLSLRVAVFVVEQTCYYQELDGKDLAPKTQHVMGYLNDNIVAYTRILAPGVSYPDYTSIGRVIVDKSCRGMNVGNQLMERSMVLSRELWPESAVKISAQEPLEKFYNQFGFEKASAMYLEDDIPHISMISPR